MRTIGFSTGALALGDWQKALSMLEGSSATAIELSTLREHEFIEISGFLQDLEVPDYTFVSFHVPSELVTLSEKDVVRMLRPLVSKGWPIVIHPNIITEYSLWESFGDQLFIENMDERKSKGRTAKGLAAIFGKLPSASLCFDIGHARHIDRTMSEAMAIVLDNQERLKMIHLSEVDMFGNHIPLSNIAMQTFALLGGILPPDVPLIVESPLGTNNIDSVISKVEKDFTYPKDHSVAG